MSVEMTAFQLASPKEMWEVFLLFTIPWGGGIPAGVLLGQKYSLGWVPLSVLYFFSDICLALVFEPLMLGFIHFTRNNLFFIRWREEMRRNTLKITQKMGRNPSPLSLVLVAFGVDPMTGRAAAQAAGHGFISGWAIAITGDMFFFGLIMISTLWLNSILGDGFWTMLIIVSAIILVPKIIEKMRSQFQKIFQRYK